MTLLQIVNRTLSAINSIDVTDVADTEESQQVVDLTTLVLEDMYGRYPWLHRKERGTLDAGATTNDMAVPSDVAGIEWIWYTGNITPTRKIVNWLDPFEFQKLINERLNSGNSNVDAQGALDDVDPRWWTTFDQETILFDAYKTSLDNTKSNCLFIKIPTLPTASANTPDIPAQFHYVVLQGTIYHAFRTMKGDDAAGDRYFAEYKRGLVSMKRYADVVQISPETRTPTWVNSYGRRRTSAHRAFDNKVVVEA
jgi:hypothetical protein